MGELFNVENDFFQWLNKVIDSVMLNAFWLLCCIPAITFAVLAWQNSVILFWLLFWAAMALAGPATTAFYYVTNKVLRHSRSYIWREYWHAFRTNFKQAAAAALIMTGLGLFMAMDSYIMQQFARNGDAVGNLYVVFVLFLMALIAWSIYVFTYMARFANPLKQLLKNTALIAIANLPWTVLLLLLLGGAVFLILILPPLLMVVPVIYMRIANLILERVFKKYMSAEDLAVEEERNRDSYH